METQLHCSVNKCIDSCKQLTLQRVNHIKYTNVYVTPPPFFLTENAEAQLRFKSIFIQSFR